MLSLLHRSIFVLLTITMAACTSVEDPPGAGGSGGTAGSGGGRMHQRRGPSRRWRQRRDRW